MTTVALPGSLILKSSCYAHVVSSELKADVCDSCLSRPNIFDHLPQETLYRCSKCKTSYYCNIACQKKAWPEHSKECKYLKRVHPKKPPDIVRLILRVIERHLTNPDVSEKLPDGRTRKFDDLMMHKNNISASVDKSEAFTTFLSVIRACVGETHSADYLFEVYCRILINSTEITDLMGSSIGTGLYLGLSAVDHSCRPNVNVVFNGKGVELRALEPITSPVFSNIRISYHNSVSSKIDRQLRLKKDYFFECSCEMCQTKEIGLLEDHVLQCCNCKGPIYVNNHECSTCGFLSKKCRDVKDLLLPEKLEDEDVFQMFNILKYKIHIFDYRMIRLTERAMDLCLSEARYALFFDLGKELLKAYAIYYPQNSLSLGLHIAKLAKTAIYLEKYDEALQMFDQSFEIFEMGYGRDSKMCDYMIALRRTI